MALVEMKAKDYIVVSSHSDMQYNNKRSGCKL